MSLERILLASPTDSLNVNDSSALTTLDAINAAFQAAGVTQQQLAAMVTALEILDNAIDANEMQVDIIAALPTGTNVIGKVRLVTSSGDEVTDDTSDAIKSFRTKGGISNSGVKSADTTIKASAGDVYWLTVSDTAALAIEINNSTGNGGSDVWALNLPADGYGHFIFDPPIECSAGIYLDVSTGTCKVTIGFI